MDDLLSLRDYAKSRNISYEAIRKQVKRYNDTLKGHIVMHGNIRMLDAEAISFLDSKRNNNPAVIIAKEVTDVIKEKDNQIEILKGQIMQLQQKLLTKDEQVIELQNKIIMITDKQEPPKKWWQFWK